MDRDTTIRTTVALLLLGLTIGLYAGRKADTSAESRCPTIKIAAERLPDMNIARASHCTFMLNGELTVVGGHTEGFVPTPTAEYLNGGRWHTVNMVYTHDNGFSAICKSGMVLVAGGHDQPLGIGQTFMAERYNPKTHSFTGFGCLDLKRSLAQGVELEDGRVVISGNHYNKDATETFDGKKYFAFLKNASQSRCCPYIFRTAPDNAMIISSNSDRFVPYDTIIVDRIKGGPLYPELLKQWAPYPFERPFRCEDSFIGDEKAGDYSYLMHVFNEQGQAAIAVVRDTTFSLLPTTAPVPMSFKGDVIEWLFPLVVDRKAKTAYMIGWGGQRALVLTIEYTRTPAPITLCYTDELPDFGSGIPVIDEGGNLIVTGGINHEHDNFDPLKTVWRLRVGRTTQAGLLGSGYLPIAVLVVLLIGACASIFIVRRKPADEADKTQDTTADDDPKEQQPLSSKQQNSRELMERIRKVVESEKLYLNSELKMSDVAAMLHTNSTYISESINTQKKCSFSQFINSYRVEYAKRLIRSNPDAKLSTLCIEAGFSNETSFFRTFKAMTGMTPNEWRKTNEQP